MAVFGMGKNKGESEVELTIELANVIQEMVSDKIQAKLALELISVVKKIVANDVKSVCQHELELSGIKQENFIRRAIHEELRKYEKPLFDEWVPTENWAREDTIGMIDQPFSSYKQIRKMPSGGGWDLADIVGGSEWLTDDEAGR